MVLGVGSVIKVHNRTVAVMAIKLRGLIPRIIHHSVGPVSDHEEGCRWSGECRWLKRREPLWGERARYANILKCLILSIVQISKFPICITNEAKHQTQKRNYKSILGSESPGHNISMVTTSKDWLAEWLHGNSVTQENLQLTLEHSRFKPLQYCSCTTVYVVKIRQPGKVEMNIAGKQLSVERIGVLNCDMIRILGVLNNSLSVLVGINFLGAFF